MTSKERAALRAQANRLEPVFQVGKEGATEAVAAQMREAFRTRELLKGRALLERAPQPPRAVAEALAKLAEAEVVQVIGGSMIFFKENPELRKEEAKKAKVVKRKIVAAKASKRFAKPSGGARQPSASRTTAAARKSAQTRRREGRRG
ncbi:MAG: YhbY family RNA-binding protein [Oscillospiraceae bacterium]|jgi:RNA-binding protein|nr:YhbY family RNA-binding protein [Oscillospiraceae bacterium]